LGPKQKRILEALTAGQWSLEALLAHIDAKTAVQRGMANEVLRGLVAQGLVRMSGLNGRGDRRGVTVELVAEPVASERNPSEGRQRQPGQGHVEVRFPGTAATR